MKLPQLVNMFAEVVCKTSLDSLPDNVESESEKVCLEELKRQAKLSVPKPAYEYYATGANDDCTLKENRLAFERLKLRPRVLRQVSCQDTCIDVLGHALRMPICIAPTAFQAMLHPDGEKATARAAAAVGTCMALSSYSTFSLEEVAEAAPGGLRWFQLYVYTDREFTKSLVQRAEAAGYKALLLTVDTPYYGSHHSRWGFHLPEHLCYSNFASLRGMSVLTSNRLRDRHIASLLNADLNWEAVDWLRSITSLPIVLKGILTAEDARLAVQHGARGILVSNHGGRQLDGASATIEVLPEIAQAVEGRAEIYLDGGVRRGTDVLKALALGARAVFIGRPVGWGLAYKGEEGVRGVLKTMWDELKLAMALTGCSSLGDISSSLVSRQSTSKL